MSLKSDVVALLQQKKAEKVEAIAMEFDAMIASVEALDDGVVLPPEVEALQAKIAELEGKLVDAKAAFDADEVLDEEALTAEHEKLLKAQQKLEALKAILDA